MSHAQSDIVSNTHKPIEVVTPDEFLKLLNRFPMYDEYQEPNFYNLRRICQLLLMYDAGLRLNELVTLAFDDILWDKTILGSVRIRATNSKNGLDRTIPMTSRLSEYLKFYTGFISKFPNFSEKWYVFFVSDPMKPYNPRAIQFFVTRLVKRVLKRHASPHTLRHSFATNCMRCSSVKVVQTLLGHKSIQSTQIYMHPAAADLVNAICNLPKTDYDLNQMSSPSSSYGDHI